MRFSCTCVPRSDMRSCTSRDETPISREPYQRVEEGERQRRQDQLR